MGSITISGVEQKYKDWLGYKEGDNNWTIFSKILDDCGYYSPQKKQNVEWCTTTINFMFLEASTPEDRPNTERKWDAMNYLYQKTPNYSAGAEEHAGYFKSAGKFFTDQREARKGDVIYFWRKVNGKTKIGHAGWVCKTTNSVISTYEGNTANMLQEKWYDIGDNTIAGFGRPYYDDEPSTATKPVVKEKTTKGQSDTQKIEDKPVAEKPKSDKLKVTTEGDNLMMRVKPTTQSHIIGAIPNKTVLTELGVTNGEFINGDNTWFKVKFGDTTAWVSGAYLTRL